MTQNALKHHIHTENPVKTSLSRVIQGRLHNLQEALVGAANRYPKQIREAAQAVAIEGSRPPPAPMKTTRAERLKQRHRQQRLARYERVMELHRQGLGLRAIARQLGMHRRTVRRFVQAGSFPERVTRDSSSQVDPFNSYLRQRWEQGCHNAAQLTQELASRGFRGSCHTVRRRVARWRSPDRRSGRIRDGPKTRKRIRSPSPRRVAWWLVQPVADLKPYPKAFLGALYERCDALKRVAELAQTFVQMVRDRRADRLDHWLEQARKEGVIRFQNNSESI